MNDDKRIREFLAAFRSVFPGRRPPSREMIRRVLESVDAAPPMSNTLRRRIGHLFTGGRR